MKIAGGGGEAPCKFSRQFGLVADEGVCARSIFPGVEVSIVVVVEANHQEI
jgi:hypothetical protein